MTLENRNNFEVLFHITFNVEEQTNPMVILFIVFGVIFGVLIIAIFIYCMLKKVQVQVDHQIVEATDLLSDLELERYYPSAVYKEIIDIDSEKSDIGFTPVTEARECVICLNTIESN